MQHLKIVSEYNAYIVITFDIATAYVTGLIAKKILSLVEIQCINKAMPYA